MEKQDYKIEVLHQKGRRKLVRLIPSGDDVVIRFGVVDGDDIVMTGTKAEAKQFYGNWRKE